MTRSNCHARRIRLRPRTSQPHRRKRLLFEGLEHRHLLATIAVDSVEDILNPDDEITTFREAIIEANSTVGLDLITLPAGTYSLSLLGSSEDAAASGDVDLTDDVTIFGAGAGQTIIDAAALGDRVFHVLNLGNSPLLASIEGVTITGGNSVDRGAGLFNHGGTVTVLDSAITGNSATIAAAPFYNERLTNMGDPVDGSLRLINTPLTNNVAAGEDSQQLARDLGSLLRNKADDVVDGIDGLFSRLTGQLQATFSSVDIPVVGDQVVQGLQPMFDAIDRVRDQSVSFLQAVLDLSERSNGPTPQELFQNALFLVLGHGDAGFDQLDPVVRDVLQPVRQGRGEFGLNILRDSADLGPEVNPHDVTVTIGEDNQGLRWLEFGVFLGQDTIVDVPAFDFGLDSIIEFLRGDNSSSSFDFQGFLDQYGFLLTATNGIRFDARWDLGLGLGVSELPSQAFYFNSGATLNGRVDGIEVPELKARVFAFAAPSTRDTPVQRLFEDVVTTPALTGDINLGILRSHISDGTPPDIRISAASSGLDIGLQETRDFSGPFDIVVDRYINGELHRDEITIDYHSPGGADTLASLLLNLNAALFQWYADPDNVPVGEIFGQVPPVLFTLDFSAIDRFFNPTIPTTPFLVLKVSRTSVGAVLAIVSVVVATAV